ncbi:CRISPR-associated helicase Cas3' [Nocardiopsis sp. CNT-189]|uniref:CRISPR-associated helicase Cas3' n=1 Tax=Nocardiopsis oceanisediminis TaxID=2816862 RepID=UPI003B3A3B4D
MAYPFGSSASPEEAVDLRLWAKERDLGGYRHPAACHALDAAAMALVLWEEAVAPGVRATISASLATDEEHAGRLIAFWAGLHDVGKVSPEFQHQIDIDLPSYPSPRDLAGRAGHATATARWLEQALPTAGYAPTWEFESVTALVAQLLGGHHGHFPEFSDPPAGGGSRAGTRGDAWDQQRWRMLRVLETVLDSPRPPGALPEPVAGIICGLVILADWLVSQKHHVLAQKPHVPSTGGMEELRSYFNRQRRGASQVLDEAGLRPLTTTPGTFSASFPEFKANGLQASIAEHLPRICAGAGLLLVTAPTGEGKTEAAFHAADIMGHAAGRPGRYIALPTMATADQMYTRLRCYAERRADVPRPLTLLHSMAWLNEDYRPAPVGQGAPAVLTADASGRRDFNVTDWLFGRKRGLLASWSVGTIDQILMAVLRARHNVLRLFGLAGKVVVVDEAHAVDPYMQEELERLLQWLGRLGVPVVLLSATLHRTVADAYVSSYLKGAGKRSSRKRFGRRRRGRAESPLVDRVDYPGWIYADAESGEVSRNPEPITGKERDPLRIDLVSIPQTGRGRERRADRSAALEDELGEILESGAGSAAVICTTVGEAQETYDLIGDLLRKHAESGREVPELHLLHARFPAEEREKIARRVIAKFGKENPGKERPKSAILVATAIIEQSLDLDFDLVVTDLAPVSLLLQRAGRCWRHQGIEGIRRPRWAEGPRMVVFVPEGGKAADLPPGWAHIYPASLLVRTRNMLEARQGEPVKVPGDVQGLVERVYDDPGLIDDMKHDLERAGKDMGMRTQARNVLVPGPGELNGGLYELTSTAFGVDEEMLATRFDADSVRVLCYYRDADGRRWLDRKCEVPLPERGSTAKGAFTDDDLAPIIRRTVPVRGGRWVPGRPEREGLLPPAWRKDFRLRELILVPQEVTAGGEAGPGDLGGRTWWLDHSKGLMWW